MPVFLGCEGGSEQAYGALLGRFARETPGVHVHISVEVLQPGAGDPLALVTRAVQKITDIEKRRDGFAYKAVLIDLGEEQKNQEAARLARAEGIQIIWQNPDHEGLLLRHLDGCQTLRPPRGASFNALCQHWPQYEKGQTVVQLADRVSLERVRRACGVEPELRAFLNAIKLL